ncbi:MAG: T9SS type A sorting domain-containing protein [Chitinophagales bacterium]|nr:T9SS type A sorting domain-containing protein [Chitinophagales bacterium]
MKTKINILIAFFLTVSCLRLTAQITLEHTFDSTAYGSDLYITDIGNNNSKFVFIDTATNSFSLYNLDANPFLLNIPTPDPILPDYTVAYITNSLFDCDSTTIEYAFMSYLTPNLPFRVLRSDGTVLLHVDSAQGPVCYGCIAGTKEIVPIVNTQEGAKLVLFKYNSSYIGKTLIYGLCGTLPTTNNIFNFSQDKLFVKVYPNPTAMSINFDVTLPDNQKEYEIIIFDSGGGKLKSEVINSSTKKFTLDVSNLTNGAYFYSLSNKTKNYQTGKFVITR